MNDIQAVKYEKVRKALKGLDVDWLSHSEFDDTKNMARVNGYSIVWHQWSYGHDDPDEVEVMDKYTGDCDRQLIAGLRELVTRTAEDVATNGMHKDIRKMLDEINNGYDFIKSDYCTSSEREEETELQKQQELDAVAGKIVAYIQKGQHE